MFTVQLRQVTDDVLRQILVTCEDCGTACMFNIVPSHEGADGGSALVWWTINHAASHGPLPTTWPSYP